MFICFFFKFLLENQDEKVEVRLNMNSDHLPNIIDYLEYHYNNEPKEIPAPLRADFSTLVSDYDLKFVDRDANDLFVMLTEANYLGITPLVNLLAAKIASFLKVTNVEKIRKLFNIDLVFSDDDIENIAKEFQDLFEI